LEHRRLEYKNNLKTKNPQPKLVEDFYF